MYDQVLPSNSDQIATDVINLSINTETAFNESFTVDEVSNQDWVFGSVGESDQPFLTARAIDTASPGGIPGNPAVQLDSNGDGALRLTHAEQYQVGFALLDQSLASEQGLSLSFDFFAYGGTGADGISVLLLDGSQPLPTDSGAYGGALGYSPRDTADLPTSIPGIAGGYLGIGLDGFGNFSNPTEGREGGPGFVPDAVAVRGSAANGYEYLTGNTVPFSIDNPGSAATREASLRKAQIELTADGLLTVTIQADLNQDGDFNDLNETVTPIDAYDVDAVNGALPDSFRIGFAGATGAATNIHEIRNLQITGQPIDPIAPTEPPVIPPEPPVIPPEPPAIPPEPPTNVDEEGGSSHCKPGKRIKGDDQNNTLKGGKNSDKIWGKGGKDRLYGGDCGDAIDAGHGNDVIYGGGKRDRLRGRQDHDHVSGNHGHDELEGGLGKDTLRGGRGNDLLHGRRGNDDLNGKYGNDIVYGGRNKDRIKGGSNHDRLEGNQNGDTVYGQRGKDYLNGGLGHDRMYGSGGNDALRGGRGNDTLHGGAGRDTLDAGSSNDILVGGNAADVLKGGEGTDRFVFKSTRDRHDRITDFETNEVIDLRQIFAQPRYASANPFGDYIRLVQQGANAIVQIDVNGDLAPDGFKAFATLQNVLVAGVGANNFAV